MGHDEQPKFHGARRLFDPAVGCIAQVYGYFPDDGGLPNNAPTDNAYCMERYFRIGRGEVEPCQRRRTRV